MAFLRFVLVALLIGMLPMCSGSGGQGDGGEGTDVPDAVGGDVPGDGSAKDADAGGGDPGPPPLLDPAHTGWKSKDCGLCHSLPPPGHTASRSPDCASCHGGNGSCDPNSSSMQHQRTQNCTGCHQNKHGFDSNPDCVSCHFAFAGTVDCGEPPDGGLDGG